MSFIIELLKSAKKILLPEKNISFIVPLSEEEIKQKIVNNILLKEKLSQFYIRNNYIFRDFEGYIKNSEFFIREILKYGYDSFIPLISGVLDEEDTNFTKISMNISFQKITKYGFIFFYFFDLLMLTLDITSGAFFSIPTLGTFLFIIIQISVINIFFKIKYKKVVEFIKSVFPNQLPIGN